MGSGASCADDQEIGWDRGRYTGFEGRRSAFHSFNNYPFDPPCPVAWDSKMNTRQLMPSRNFKGRNRH